jgi:hypothetical protein
LDVAEFVEAQEIKGAAQARRHVRRREAGPILAQPSAPIVSITAWSVQLFAPDDMAPRVHAGHGSRR